jgi:uncharacterized protein (TIGR03437 family)
MIISKARRNLFAVGFGLAVLTLGLAGIAKSQQAGTNSGPGPDLLPPAFQHAVGDPVAGQAIFRYETFGNQGFWTDAMQLPQGIAAAQLTPLQALQVGLNVNVAALNAPTVAALSAALQQVQSGMDPTKTAFGDPSVTLSLIEQQAVMGVVVFDPTGAVKSPGNTGTLNLAAGDKVGLTCPVCHGITDNSVLAPNAALKTKGSVGKEIDGPANHGVDVGAIFATALRPLAYYPMLQLQFKALNNATIGRGDFAGLLTTASSLPTEQQAIQYLTGTSANGQRYYPVGQFDAFPDGIGAPVHNPPFFRTDLSAPWGVDGAVDNLSDFNNIVYTVALDPTSVLTPAGRNFLHAVAGPVGDEIANDYEQVLKGIGVIPAGKNTLDVVPFVKAATVTPSTDGAPVGLRVDATKLINLNAYTNSLQAPAPGPFDVKMAALGQAVFAGSGGCTGCHQLDPNKFVPPALFSMKALYPGYNPTVIFSRAAPLSPIEKSFGGPSPSYDNRQVVIDATREGNIKGFGLPLKLDLARRTALLHDDEIFGPAGTFDDAADIMMNPARRDPMAAHAFFVPDANERKALIEFMKSLGASPATFTPQGVGNAASYMSGGVSPGELVAISGARLGIPMANASMQNTQVTFDGIAATLISVTSTQITVMTPVDIAGEATTALKVVVNGVSAPTVSLNVALTAPGIFTVAGPTGIADQAAVLNPDGTVNSQSNPAPRGSEIAIFATGQGETYIPANPGTGTGASLPMPAAAVSATIDGQTAQVVYAGGAPGLVSGVLQVNAIVPIAAGTGNVQLVITVGGASSQRGATIWVN